MFMVRKTQQVLLMLFTLLTYFLAECCLETESFKCYSWCHWINVSFNFHLSVLFMLYMDQGKIWKWWIM